jgi:diacylglycerol kinase (ATP)
MRCKVIANPSSGPWEFRGQLSTVVSLLKEHGWQPTLHITEHAGEATVLARQARDQGLDAVFVAGGDGTINEVVNGLVESPVAVGVLPAGSGNVWAKGLGLPRRSPINWLPLVHSVKALLAGTTRTIDVGRANGRYFLQWTGIGLDAEVTYAVEPRTRVQRRLGTVGYIAKGLAVATTLAGTRARITIDGQLIYRRAILVVISNSRLYGGVAMAMDARVDDGLLDIDVFSGSGFASSMRTFLSVITGLHVHDPRHSVFRGRTIRIETDKPMAIHVDSEPFSRTPLECEVVPKALVMMLPRRSPPHLFAEAPASDAPTQEAR